MIINTGKKTRNTIALFLNKNQKSVIIVCLIIIAVCLIFIGTYVGIKEYNKVIEVKQRNCICEIGKKNGESYMDDYDIYLSGRIKVDTKKQVVYYVSKRDYGVAHIYSCKNWDVKNIKQIDIEKLEGKLYNHFE